MDQIQVGNYMKNKLTIDRTKWLRGEGSRPSKLLRPEDGKMCCVGFYCLANGIPEAKISNEAWPGTDWSLIPSMQWLVAPYIIQSKMEQNLSWLNDTQEITEDERELLIAELFAKHDVEVRFIN